MARTPQSWLLQSIGAASKAKPEEFRAALIAFSCNFALLASYYILRPVREAAQQGDIGAVQSSLHREQRQSA